MRRPPRSPHPRTITTAAPEAWSTIFATALNTHVVQFGDHFPLHRLPLRDGSIDLTPLAGTLDEDIACRDFTVDSLAVPLSQVPVDFTQLDPSEVIDQHDGLADLTAHRLRRIWFVSPSVRAPSLAYQLSQVAPID